MADAHAKRAAEEWGAMTVEEKEYHIRKQQIQKVRHEQQQKIEKFITHYVWYAQDKNGTNSKPGAQAAS